MLIFYLSLSLIVSFVCSLLEAVILSVTPSYIESLKETEPNSYIRVRDLKTDLEKYLASILTFNTIAHTIGAAGAGAEAQRVFGNQYFTLFSILLTFAILFLSEIIPKSFGASYWKSLLDMAMTLLRPMVVISLPIVWLSERVSKLFKKTEDTMSAEELKAVAEMGLKQGVIQANQFHAITGMLKFNDLKVIDIIRRKEEVASLSHNLSLQEALDEISSNTFSRLIVYGVDENDIKGFVLRTDIQKKRLENSLISSAESSLQLKDMTKPVLILSSQVSLSQIMNRLLERREHICTIINEYGEFLGILTLEDILEKMLNLEIFDELDHLNQ